MNKKFLWLAVGGLMALSLVMAACSTATTSTTTTATTPQTSTAQTTTTTAVAPATTTTPAQGAVTPSNAKPVYGGTLNLFMAADVSTWDPQRVVTSQLTDEVSEHVMQGDWAKGQAGGYGTNQTDWAYADNNLVALKTGALVDSATWTVDAANNVGHIVYEVKQGVHWALDPKNAASALVGGRQMTADDIVYSLQRETTWAMGYIYLNNAELRTANITKTGPWEVTVTLPLAAMNTGILRYNSTVLVVPQEVVAKYGNMEASNLQVGTGAFILQQYVTGSLATLVRNPNYHGTNPVGPGKGDQLPYLDGINILILPDTSTQMAAMRVGKLDQYAMLTKDNANQIKQGASQLQEQISLSFEGRGNPPLCMRIDTAPFTDVRVRQAMCMCVDYNAILQGYFGGEGQIYTWPYTKIREYQEIYLDPSNYDATAKSLYSYNVDGAKALLAQAGYPNGFKTSIICSSVGTTVDFLAIYKDDFSKIGVDMAIQTVAPGVYTQIMVNRSHTQMIAGDTAPIAIFANGQQISGPSHNNLSMVNDPYINDQLVKIRLQALTDENAAMDMYRAMTNYIIDQAYVVPAVTGGDHTLWWPWLKNYSGELYVGYDYPIWPNYIWYDRTLKASMGK